MCWVGVVWVDERLSYKTTPLTTFHSPLFLNRAVAGVGARSVAERVQAALGGEARVSLEVAQDIVVRACFVRARQQQQGGRASVSGIQVD